MSNNFESVVIEFNHLETSIKSILWSINSSDELLKETVLDFLNVKLYKAYINDKNLVEYLNKIYWVKAIQYHENYQFLDKSQIETMKRQVQEFFNIEFTVENVSKHIGSLFVNDVDTTIGKSLCEIYYNLTFQELQYQPYGYSVPMIVNFGNYHTYDMDYKKVDVVQGLLNIVRLANGKEKQTNFHFKHFIIEMFKKEQYGEWVEVNDGIEIKLTKNGKAQFKFSDELAKTLHSYVSKVVDTKFKIKSETKVVNKKETKFEKDGKEFIKLSDSVLEEFEWSKRYQLDNDMKSLILTKEKWSKVVVSILRMFYVDVHNDKIHQIYSYHFNIHKLVDKILELGYVPSYENKDQEVINEYLSDLKEQKVA